MYRSFPYVEDSELYQDLMSSSSDYWTQLESCGGKIKCSEEFKEIFMGMMKKDPEERYSLDYIRTKPWFKGPVYSENRLASIMKGKITRIKLNLGKKKKNSGFFKLKIFK